MWFFKLIDWIDVYPHSVHWYFVSYFRRIIDNYIIEKSSTSFVHLRHCVASHVSAKHSDRPHKTNTFCMTSVSRRYVDAYEFRVWICGPIYSHIHCRWTVWCDCGRLWCAWTVFSMWQIHSSKCHTFSSNTNGTEHSCRCAHWPCVVAVEWIGQMNLGTMNIRNRQFGCAIEDDGIFSLKRRQKFNRIEIAGGIWKFTVHFTSENGFKRTKWTFEEINVDFMLFPHVRRAIAPHSPFTRTIQTFELTYLFGIG